MSQKETQEIMRRLRILEGALGIDLDESSDCTGDPMGCKADPCSRDTCPMAHTYVQQLLNGTELNVHRISLLMLAFEEAELHGLFPKGFWRLVNRRNDLAAAWADHHLAEQRYEEARGTPRANALGGALASASIALDKARSRYNTALKEVFPNADAATENGT